MSIVGLNNNALPRSDMRWSSQHVRGLACDDVSISQYTPLRRYQYVSGPKICSFTILLIQVVVGNTHSRYNIDAYLSVQYDWDYCDRYDLTAAIRQPEQYECIENAI